MRSLNLHSKFVTPGGDDVRYAVRPMTEKTTSEDQAMFDFFKGWRRKIGAVVLVMACMFASGWVRSIGHGYQSILSFTQNRFSPPDDQIVHYFYLTEDGMEWTTERAGGWKDFKTWKIPHHSFAIALSLLSAYLLLSTSRPAIPTKTHDLTPAAGA